MFSAGQKVRFKNKEVIANLWTECDFDRNVYTILYVDKTNILQLDIPRGESEGGYLWVAKDNIVRHETEEELNNILSELTI